jgi:transposase InsO family protein
MTLEACGYPDGCAGVGRVRGGHGHVGTFNGRLRDELFAREAFDGVLEARILFDDCADVYNRHRPHGSLGYLAPAVFAAAWKLSRFGFRRSSPSWRG